MFNIINEANFYTNNNFKKITETNQLANMEVEKVYYDMGHSPDKCKGTCIGITVKA